ISNLIPCKFTGKPFWDIYLFMNPPLHVAYMEAAKKFGFDAWYIYGGIPSERAGAHAEDWNCEIIEETDERKVQRRFVRTPYGRLEQKTIYPRDNPPWTFDKIIKDLEEDWPKLRFLHGDTLEWEPKKQNDIVGDLGVYAISVLLPWDWWFLLRHGGLSRATIDLYEHPKLMDEIFRHYKLYAIEFVKACIEAEPDEIILQGSASSNSQISPAIFEKVDLPLIKEITNLCRRRGIISHLHVCGKSRKNIDLAYKHTKLDVIEPLERPPGGDVDLAEAKKMWGDKLCLKGNVNTFETMMSRSPRNVEAEALRCLLAAAGGGGYVLSTGDQVPRDAPEANLFILVEAGKKYGTYPIDKNGIRKRLENIGGSYVTSVQ
ncbi:MAG: hypothetical protein JSW53_03690, partial [Candidatus Bathyarchaeota archaeon]